jgi:hypothetical protein
MRRERERKATFPPPDAFAGKNNRQCLEYAGRRRALGLYARRSSGGGRSLVAIWRVRLSLWMSAATKKLS